MELALLFPRQRSHRRCEAVGMQRLTYTAKRDGNNFTHFPIKLTFSMGATLGYADSATKSIKSGAEVGVSLVPPPSAPLNDIKYFVNVRELRDN